MTDEQTPSIRDQMVTLAKSYVGVGDNDATRTQYLDLIAPNETPSRQKEMLSMSSCALVVSGLLRKLGLNDDRLNRPYVIGSAMSTCIGIAKDHNAIHPPTYASPKPGDMVYIHGDSGQEHIYTIVEIDQNDGDSGMTIVSVDGGQRDTAGRECIKARMRQVDVSATIPSDVTQSPNGQFKRKIGYFLDLDAIMAQAC